MITGTYKFNVKRSPIDNRDFKVGAIYPDQVTLPVEWDYRKQMNPIRDQGQEGSCLAETVSAMKEWQELVDQGYKGYMSSQFVYNLRADYTEEGMVPRDGMKILNKIGIVHEDVYPYGKIEQLDASTLSPKILTLAAANRILGYAQIDTLDSLKKALFANGPCLITFPVYNPEVMEFWKPTSIGQESLGGHAVCVAGYLKDRFIIRNSWSNTWGDAGYTYFPFTEWGMHWEAWTAMDEHSNMNDLNKKIDSQKVCFWKKLFGK
jgi:C1A family cysteine protease